MLKVTFFTYAARRTLALPERLSRKDWIDAKIFLPLALVVVLARRFELVMWFAPAILLLGAVFEKESKLTLDKRAQRILVLSLALNIVLVLNIKVVLAPLFVLLVPLTLTLARLIIGKKR